jgi:hypothetical protein
MTRKWQGFKVLSPKTGMETMGIQFTATSPGTVVHGERHQWGNGLWPRLPNEDCESCPPFGSPLSLNANTSTKIRSTFQHWTNAPFQNTWARSSWGVLREDEVGCEICKHNYKPNSVCIQFWLVYNHLTNRKKLICHYCCFEITFKGRITVHWELQMLTRFQLLGKRMVLSHSSMSSSREQ